MKKSDKVNLKPLSKSTSNRLMRLFEHIAELHYKGEITSKEFESEFIKLGYELEGELLKKNGVETNVRLTKEILDSGLSKNGAYNKRQLQALGTKMENNKGWRRKLIGKMVTQHQVDRFLELKDVHLKCKKDLHNQS